MIGGRLFTLLALVLVTGTAGAHHRQTPGIARFTAQGDNQLPRVSSSNGVFALAISNGGESQVVRYAYPYPVTTQTVTTQGQPGNPVVSLNGSVVVWDADASPSGRQVFLRRGDTVEQITHDQTGTSQNAAVNGTGSRIAFDSQGDLANPGTGGQRHVYVWNRDGTVLRVSQGSGRASNAAMSRRGKVVAFESTSAPGTGIDTGISQVWLYDIDAGSAFRITDGAGPSRAPAFSSDGLVLVFESAADLAGNKADTGVTQIFAFDTHTGTFAQITNATTDPTGCTSASIHKFRRDWRIPFLCAGQVNFYLLRADERYAVAMPGGDTTRVLAQPGLQFLMVSTTADLLQGGTTPNHQIYLINLFKQPPQPVRGTATWFPARGIPLDR